MIGRSDNDVNVNDVKSFNVIERKKNCAAISNFHDDLWKYVEYTDQCLSLPTSLFFNIWEWEEVIELLIRIPTHVLWYKQAHGGSDTRHMRLDYPTWAKQVSYLTSPHFLSPSKRTFLAALHINIAIDEFRFKSIRYLKAINSLLTFILSSILPI